MYISWLGLSCFKIQTSNCTIITDPISSASGIKMPKLQADVVVISQPNEPKTSDTGRVSGDPYIISGPGEYEVKMVSIKGATDQVNGQPIQPNFGTLYYMEADNIGIGFLGSVDHPLANVQLEIMEEVDVLLVPVGGQPVLTPEKAAEVISQIEPRIVIPMYYKTPGLKLNLQPLNKFLHTMGIKDPEELPKLKVNERELPQDETKTIVLKP